MTAVDYCSDCPYLRDVGGNEEFWGSMCHCPEWECEFEYEDASDPDCPYYGDWAEDHPEEAEEKENEKDD